eukprot:TRINITY_DN13552_c3_g1_i1.p1 TRINITY_DN13552_c3_g1~~TRINITY_DN13552_c3_g1_i1.p1  ORF type:complete len:323 (-),score=44.21 TRINITY_DN13552_c3_g1_i1:430-1398(-)
MPKHCDQRGSFWYVLRLTAAIVGIKFGAFAPTTCESFAALPTKPVRAATLLALRYRNADREKILATSAEAVEKGRKRSQKGVLRLIRADGTDGGIVTSGDDLVLPSEVLVLPTGALLPAHALLESQNTRVWGLNKPSGWSVKGPEVQGWLESVGTEMDVESKRRVLEAMAAGHLDKATSGLLLVTNSAYLSQRLEQPEICSNEYVATVRGHVLGNVLDNLRAGIIFSDGLIRFSNVHKVSTWIYGQQYFTKLRLEICESRHHIIRHALEHEGHQVVLLHKERIGAISCGGVVPNFGDNRELSRQLVHEFWRQSELPSWRDQL